MGRCAIGGDARCPTVIRLTGPCVRLFSRHMGGQSGRMAHTMETAKTGRSGCRTCGTKIEKDTLRVGEEVPNAFNPEGGLTFHWHHLMCAAKAKPHALRDALEKWTEPIPDRAALEAAMAEGLATARPPFPFAEHASTARSRCQGCRKNIDKGELRIALARPPDAMPRDSAMYVHTACAMAFVKDPLLLEKVLKHSRGLEAADVAALQQVLVAAPTP